MFEAPKLDDISKGLLRAAEIIEERGWWDGKSYKPLADGKICAGLAVNEVFRNSEAKATKAFDRLARQAGVPARIDIPAWNDRSDAETVVRTIREAAYNNL
jgi:hypothetical protein